MSHPRLAAGLLFVYLAFVVYGSLVPLDFNPLPLGQAWQDFLALPYLDLGIESRADWVANGVLYLPLGVLAARALQPLLGRSSVLAGLLAFVLCAALAVAVEFAQQFFPPRTVSQNDLAAEFIGSLLGVSLAPALARWAGHVRAAWAAGGSRLGLRLLEVYAASYLVLAFFPYDLLLSRPEIAAKWQSGSWGWLFADSDRGLFIVALIASVEVALCMPLGVLAARLYRGAKLTWGMSLTLGLLLGLLIEVGQFFIVSGVSQGASVLGRGLGLVIGAALAGQLDVNGLARARHGLARLAPWLLLAYLPLLLLANGWFRSRWQGLEAAQAAWAELRLMPFYYHYYTSEAVALFSLGSVAIMYLPLALLAWVRGLRTRGALLAVALLALGVESGKLFLQGLHPDPTNVLIAVGVVALTLQFAAASAGAGAAPSTVMPFGRDERDAAPRESGRRWPWLLLVLVGVSVWNFPLYPWALALVLVGCGWAVWRQPAWALVIVAAALPLFDLAPWSGRLFWTEFDLLLLVCVAGAFLRLQRGAGSPRRPLALSVAFALLGLSLALSSVRPLWGWTGIDENSFSHYYSVFNGMRIVKGALWAWLLVKLYRTLPQADGEPARMWRIGMLVGLTATVAVVIWERAVFVGLFDFASEYRVTGPFSAMHKGGAYIECYLAVGAAYALSALLQASSWRPRLAAAGLLALASYAMMVTYSRNGYAALALVLLLGLVASLRWTLPRHTRVLAVALALLGVLGVALPILLGAFASERLAQSQRDLAVRQAHWADALALRDPGWASALFGAGVGRFPELHFWRSREVPRAASFQLEREAGRVFMRMGSGATVYVEQVLDPPQGEDLILALDVRGRPAAVPLTATLCRKWMLTSAACTRAELRAAAQDAAPTDAMDWRRVELRLPTAGLGAGGALAAGPVKLSLFSPPEGTVLDVSRLSLRSAAGTELLRNGDFSQGMDGWLFTTDVDPPWHIHSLPVAAYFDQGVLGALAWSLVILGALVLGGLRWRQGSVGAATAVVALLAFLGSGLLNTLIDEPRFLMLLLVLLWLCGERAQGVPAAARGKGLQPTKPLASPAP